MTYEAKSLRRQKIRYDSLNDDAPLKFQLVKNGAKVTPTSATVQIFDPEGDEVLAATALTVSGSLCTKAVDTTTEASWPLGTGYRARVIFTHTGGITEEQDFIFDVAKYLLDPSLAYDQLVAMDDRLRGMTHDGDEDFSEIIEACRDELQIMIETKAIDDGKLVENMILDESRIAIPFRSYVLAQIFETKGMDTAKAHYTEKWEAMFRAVLAGIKYDKSGDLIEDDGGSVPQVVRFET